MISLIKNFINIEYHITTMFLFALLTLICFIFKDNVDANLTDYSKDLEFGFHKGGKYEFQIKYGGDYSYLFIIQKANEIDKYLENQDLFHPCDINTSIQNFHVIQLKNGEAYFSSSIYQEGIYNIKIMSCTYFHDGFSYKASFKNPNSCLSSTEEAYIKICHIPVYVIVLLFVCWIINWLYYFSIRNIYHLLFTFGFLFLTIDKYVSVLMFKENYQSDYPSKYLQIHLFFYGLSSFFINFSIMTLNLTPIFGMNIIGIGYFLIYNLYLSSHMFSNSLNDVISLLYMIFCILPSLLIASLLLDMKNTCEFLLFSYILSSIIYLIHFALLLAYSLNSFFLTLTKHLLFDIILIISLIFLGYPLRMRPDVKLNYSSLLE